MNETGGAVPLKSVGISRSWQKSKMAAVGHLKNSFSIVWLKLQCNIWFLGFLGSRNSYFISVLQFDLVLTFESKMDANLKVTVRQFFSFVVCCS